jgi:hypothetical protein
VTANLPVEGLTIRNGRASRGGGILARASGPDSELVLDLRNDIISGNTIAANRAETAGRGGIWLNASHDGSQATAILSRNNVVDNYAWEKQDGGGMAAYASDAGASTGGTWGRTAGRGTAGESKGLFDDGFSGAVDVAYRQVEWGKMECLAASQTWTGS